MEIKCTRSKVEMIKNQCVFSHSFIADSRGLSGGIALLWKGDNVVNLLSYTKHHISVKVLSPEGDQAFILTGFYGHPEAIQIVGSWDLLRGLKPLDGKAWICLGDFNEICHQYEKVGVAERP